jgi:hypothetical protein
MSTEQLERLRLASELADAARNMKENSAADSFAKLKLAEHINQSRVDNSAAAVEEPVELSLPQRVEIDSVLMNAGFDPGIEYIKQHYGEHWNKPDVSPPIVQQVVQVPEPPDLTPVLEGFKAAFAELLRINQEQSNRLADAIAALGNQVAHTGIAQETLLAALAEARKPISVDIKLEMPAQQPKRFMAQRLDDGRMALTEEIPLLQ